MSGTVFKPLNNSVVEINSTPEQNFVATDANYSFNLTPGNYLITANYFEGKTIVYSAKEDVVISDKGEYVHDLLLFPTYNEQLLNHSGFEVPNLNFKETKHADQAKLSKLLLYICCPYLHTSPFTRRLFHKKMVSKTSYDNKSFSGRR